MVNRLDPSTGSEGFPEELWQSLAADAQPIQTDRILALIDTLADTEGRMKWASNKRLHMEIGLIKAIQSLNEARISDIIKALAGAGTLEQPALSAPATTAPVKTPAPAEVAPVVEKTPEPTKEPTPTPTPAPVKESAPPWGDTPAATPAVTTSPAQESKPEPAQPTEEVASKSFADLIEDAEDAPAAVIPQPGPALREPDPAPVAKEDSPDPKDDEFYKDPLILKALEIFEGNLKPIN